MFTSIFRHPDDILALIGLGLLTTGIYLWLGLAASLILLGGVMIFIAARMQPTYRVYDRPEPTTNPPTHRVKGD